MRRRSSSSDEEGEPSTTANSADTGDTSDLYREQQTLIAQALHATGDELAAIKIKVQALTDKLNPATTTANKLTLEQKAQEAADLVRRFRATRHRHVEAGMRKAASMKRTELAQEEQQLVVKAEEAEGDELAAIKIKTHDMRVEIVELSNSLLKPAKDYAQLAQLKKVSIADLVDLNFKFSGEVKTLFNDKGKEEDTMLAELRSMLDPAGRVQLTSAPTHDTDSETQLLMRVVEALKHVETYRYPTVSGMAELGAPVAVLHPLIPSPSVPTLCSSQRNTRVPAPPPAPCATETLAALPASVQWPACS